MQMGFVQPADHVSENNGGSRTMVFAARGGRTTGMPTSGTVAISLDMSRHVPSTTDAETSRTSEEKASCV